MGDWKLVAEGAAGPWELYDMRTDRAESNNLAEKHPEKARELSDRWTRAAEDIRLLANADVAT
jgi:arylsulfatase